MERKIPSMNLADYLLQTGGAHDPAIIAERETVTYGALREFVDAIAATLLERGVVKGARVGIFADNSPFWVASYLGILKAGGMALPFYPTLEPSQLEGLVAATGPRAFCAEEKYLARCVKSGAGAGVVVEGEAALHKAPQGCAAVAPRYQGVVPAADVDDRKDLAALMFTSGSTGTPRAVMVSHRNIMANTESIIASLELSRDDRIMVVLPFYYCFGTSLLHTHLRVGGSIVLNNRFTFPKLVLDQMLETRCTGIAGVPSTYQLLLRNSAFPRMKFPKLRKMQQAGGKLPNVFISELRAAHPYADYFLMYGATEATARLSCLPPGCLDTKLGSIGKGIPGVDLQVLDQCGNPVQPGETGEVVARGDNITLGYWQDPEATAQSFRDGALWTGDLATVDEDSFIFVVDRAKDFIKPTGHRIACKHIEDHLVAIPDVVEAAVVGVPDDVLGEAAKAFVSLRRGATLTEAEALTHCRKAMPPYMVPRELVIMGSLPKNSSGKIDKLSLKKKAGAPHSSRVPGPRA
ncbi:MAG TPA: AMP-binding protein [Candidatus Methanoperedens sp.]|nr:AMP-binding protein [Candidatus Methanoperedens sp.]